MIAPLAPYKPKHPVWRMFPKGYWPRLVADLGPNKALDKWDEQMRERNRLILLEESDPLNFGFEPAHWLLCDLMWGWITVEEFCDRAVSRWGVPDEASVELWKQLARAGRFDHLSKLILLLGGWRSSKTTYMLKRAVQCLVKYPGALIWVFHENLQASIKVHQKPVHDMLPKAWQDAGKTKVAYVSYKDKTGFSDAGFIGPNASQMMFKTYGQDIGAMQGFQLGEPEMRPCIGVVGDELMPLTLVDTLAGRCMTWGAVQMMGFTPIMGHTSVVERCVAGAVDVVSVASPDLGDPATPSMPMLKERKLSVGEGIPPVLTRTLYYPTRWNLYQPIREVMNRVAGKPMSERKKLLYGWTDKLDTGLFAKLDDRIHGFDLSKLPTEGTDWLVCDPAGARQWFMMWFRVDVFGRRWYWREWPCENFMIEGEGWPGPWAEEGLDPDSKFKGFVAGSGQSPDWGWGMERYKKEIALVEEWKDAQSIKAVKDWDAENGAKIKVYARILDGRTAATGNYRQGVEKTVLDELADLKLPFLPAEGKDVEVGITLINDGLDYTPDWTSPLQGPKIFICRDMKNLWYCLRNLPKFADRKNPLKDPVDCLRYAEGASPFYIELGAASTPGKLSKLAKLLPRANG